MPFNIDDGADLVTRTYANSQTDSNNSLDSFDSFNSVTTIPELAGEIAEIRDYLPANLSPKLSQNLKDLKSLLINLSDRVKAIELARSKSYFSYRKGGSKKNKKTKHYKKTHKKRSSRNKK